MWALTRDKDFPAPSIPTVEGRHRRYQGHPQHVRVRAHHAGDGVRIFLPHMSGGRGGGETEKMLMVIFCGVCYCISNTSREKLNDTGGVRVVKVGKEGGRGGGE